jgi:hypothetical protein
MVRFKDVVYETIHENMVVYFRFSSLTLRCLSHLYLADDNCLGTFKCGESQRSESRHLVQTDHQKLLTACRELLAEGHYGRYKVINSREPNSPVFPQAILSLKPTYVYIGDSGFVTVEMWGGMSHFGVRAFSEDFTNAYKEDKRINWGNKKLLDGLWYYDDGYENNPGFEKYIESLKPKTK